MPICVNEPMHEIEVSRGRAGLGQDAYCFSSFVELQQVPLSCMSTDGELGLSFDFVLITYAS